MPFTLRPLPFHLGDLEPILSAETVQFHYQKHHGGYVKKLNKLLKESPIAGVLDLVTIIRRSALDPHNRSIFNNAAQIWNHDFYWQSLAPAGTCKPKGRLAEAIEEEFEDMDTFKEKFSKAAMERFGSGWAWLCWGKGHLKILTTSNAETPIQSEGISPLLTIDVWEHAYYLDYRNRRRDYIKAIMNELWNWDFAAKQYALANPK